MAPKMNPAPGPANKIARDCPRLYRPTGAYAAYPPQRMQNNVRPESKILRNRGVSQLMHQDGDQQDQQPGHQEFRTGSQSIQTQQNADQPKKGVDANGNAEQPELQIQVGFADLTKHAQTSFIAYCHRLQYSAESIATRFQ